MPKSRHPDHVVGWAGSPEDLARSIANMTYDALAQFLGHLEDALEEDCSADWDRGRHTLSIKLGSAARNVGFARQKIEEAWGLCKPHTEVISPDGAELQPFAGNTSSLG